MKTEIDFLKGNRGERERKRKLLRIIRTGSILVLIIYCLVLSAFFSYDFYIKTQGEKVAKENKIKKEKIESLKEVETLQITLKQRLSSLGKFFESQKNSDYPLILDYFDKLAQEISLKTLIIQDDGKINLNGGAADAFVLERFLEKINQEETDKLFSGVTLLSLDKREDGSYFLVILFEAKNKQ